MAHGRVPGDDADALLARLNALRPSTVSLRGPPNDARHDDDDLDDEQHATRATAAAQDADLAARFARLAGRESEQGHEADDDADVDPAEYLASIANESQAGQKEGEDGHAGAGAEDDEEEEDIDALLNELAAGDALAGIGLSNTEQLEARRLLAEARHALDNVSSIQEPEPVTGDSEQDCERRSSQDDTEATEDQEADDYVHIALEEAAMERRAEDEQDGQDGQESRAGSEGKDSFDEGDDDGGMLELPSAPTALKAAEAKGGGEDDDDAAGWQLPAVPAAAPAAKKAAAGSSPPDETESWCIICCDDATVSCLGCGGDLYCGNCWAEGHRGEGAGLEERRHRAVAYSRDARKGKAKAPARRRLAAA